MTPMWVGPLAVNTCSPLSSLCPLSFPSSCIFLIASEQSFHSSDTPFSKFYRILGLSPTFCESIDVCVVAADEQCNE